MDDKEPSSDEEEPPREKNEVIQGSMLDYLDEDQIDEKIQKMNGKIELYLDSDGVKSQESSELFWERYPNIIITLQVSKCVP